MKQYYKDIEDSRIWYQGVIERGGKSIYTWDEELILADGWIKYIPEPIPPYIPSREEKIHEEIRTVYSENDELMILRQYSANPENEVYKERFLKYNEFVEDILSKYPE